MRALLALLSSLVVLILTGSSVGHLPSAATPASQAETTDPLPLASVFPTASGPAAVVYPARAIETLRRRSPAIASREESQAEGQSLVYIVMPASTTALPREPVTPEYPLHMAIVAKNDFRLLPAQPHEVAGSIVVDPGHIEPALAGSARFGTVIGSFESAQMCADCFVVLYRIKRPQPSGREVRATWARITADDLAVLR